MTRRRLASAALALCCLGQPSPLVRAQPLPPACPACLSDRVVEYDIRVVFDPQAKTLEGEQTIRYRHTGGRPLESLQFHLYWNAFRDEHSTFAREAALAGQRLDPGAAGSVDITSLRIGEAELAPALRFLHPDDANERDRSVAEVRLPAPVEPEENVAVQLRFRGRFPALVARAGYARDFFMAGQWFPKLGVFHRDLWNTHQYHYNSEFFADFGTYTVTVTAPREYVLAASGNLVSERASGGAVARTWRAEDVHDFAWAAWPGFRKLEDRWRQTRLELYHPPDHRNARRHLDAAKATLDWFARHVGEYPYSRLVIVDVPEFASEAAGMEYPTLVTTSGGWLPRSFHSADTVTIHEVGHQFFYGILASNEFEEAWLDEGLNTYCEAAIADSLYGERSSWFALPVLRGGDAGYYWRRSFLRTPALDAVVQPAWRYASPDSYGAMTYAKPLFLLRTLEQIIGRDKLLAGLRHYFQTWKFRHPTSRDLAAALRESTGQDLDWFFRQVAYRPSRLDDAVARVVTESLEGGQKAHHILVVRRGDIVLPVEMIAHFHGAPPKRLFWDGQGPWKRFSVETAHDLAWVTISTRPLDTNYLDNSFSPSADPRAAHKLAAVWSLLTQHFLELWAWAL